MTKCLLSIAGGLYCLVTMTAQAKDIYVLPDYYVEGSFQFAAAHMISNICPKIQVKKGSADLFKTSLSGRLKEDNILPPNVKESDQRVKLSLVMDKRFVGRMVSLLEKYSIDPNEKADVRLPEVYEKFCVMGTGEISNQTNIGNLIEASGE